MARSRRKENLLQRCLELYFIYETSHLDPSRRIYDG
jgi:hypothetical protein